MGITTDSATARLCGAAQAFLAAASGFDPAGAPASDLGRVADLSARVEKAASGVRVLAAARAVERGAHKDEGVADPVAWVARQAGTTGAQARSALELARSLEDHPRTKAALLSGSVSVAQAKEVAQATAEALGEEDELLGLAAGRDLSALREETRNRRLSRAEPEDLHRRQLAARRFRHWNDGLGMICFEGALPPEKGIPFVARIEREAARLRARAKRDGCQEPFERHAADALFGLLAGEGKAASPPRSDLVIVCDLFAWRRGHAHDTEPCHLIGGGPIPVSLAKELSSDAFLKAVLHDGVDIQKVSHHGRRYTAHLRTALDLGPVPALSGRACVDCGRRYGLEHDHCDPVAHTGPTSLHNVKPRCYPCHQEKTERDRKAGLLGKRARAAPPKTGRAPRSGDPP
jgi:hypothetical protein